MIAGKTDSFVRKMGTIFPENAREEGKGDYQSPILRITSQLFKDGLGIWEDTLVSTLKNWKEKG